MFSSLIIGYGQIGKALEQVLFDYNPDVVDKDPGSDVAPQYDIIHICFPYSKDFINEVKKYQEKFNPTYTIIHSTVPIGASRLCNAIHSPVVGIHPHLAESIKTFTKFLGGEQASEVADYFRRAGCKVYLYDKPETTELMKLSQTTFYALTVEYFKDLKRQCDSFGLSYGEVMTIPTVDYNRGYAELGMPEIRIPQLIPIMKPQGGHCTIPNCGLWETEFTKFIERQNEGEDHASKASYSGKWDYGLQKRLDGSSDHPDSGG